MVEEIGGNFQKEQTSGPNYPRACQTRYGTHLRTDRELPLWKGKK